MPHTQQHPTGRPHLATFLLAALLTACAVPTPAPVDAPADAAVRSAPAMPADPSPMQPAPAGATPVPDPTVVEVPPANDPLAAPSGAAQLIDKGLASWYGKRFHGRRTASGERYDMHAFTAAHKTLPFGTMVRVRSQHTGKEVVVRINDRGPYRHRRIIDLSMAAITALGVRHHGVTTVELLRE